MEQSITNKKRQKRTMLQNFQENQSPTTPHPVEKNQSRTQSQAKKNIKEDWKKIVSPLNSNAHINQVWDRLRQLKRKYTKK